MMQRPLLLSTATWGVFLGLTWWERTDSCKLSSDLDTCTVACAYPRTIHKCNRQHSCAFFRDFFPQLRSLRRLCGCIEHIISISYSGTKESFVFIEAPGSYCAFKEVLGCVQRTCRPPGHPSVSVIIFFNIHSFIHPFVRLFIYLFYVDVCPSDVC